MGSILKKVCISRSFIQKADELKLYQNIGEGEIRMKQPIIEIGRASEEAVMALIKMGILIVNETGIHVKED